MTSSPPSLGKTLKFMIKVCDRQFVTRTGSVAGATRHPERVMSQQTRNVDSTTQMSRKIAQLWLSSVKDNKPQWSAAVRRFRWRISRMLSSLAHFISSFQHLGIIYSPFAVRWRFSYLRKELSSGQVYSWFVFLVRKVMNEFL